MCVSFIPINAKMHLTASSKKEKRTWSPQQSVAASVCDSSRSLTCQPAEPDVFYPLTSAPVAPSLFSPRFSSLTLWIYAEVHSFSFFYVIKMHSPAH